MREHDAEHGSHGKAAHLEQHKLTVVDVGVDRGGRYRRDHAEEVAVVMVTDAAAGEPAVMVAFQDARGTDLTVVAARWRERLTWAAISPRLLLPGAQLEVSAGTRCVDQVVQVGKCQHVERQRDEYVRRAVSHGRSLVEWEHVIELKPYGEMPAQDKHTKRDAVDSTPSKRRIVRDELLYHVHQKHSGSWQSQYSVSLLLKIVVCLNLEILINLKIDRKYHDQLISVIVY